MKYWFFPGLLLLAVASSAVHPFGRAKVQNPALPVFEGTFVDPAALRIFERACFNCHSERTNWPWYGYLPPASWMLERDVTRGREHMNWSRWGQYSNDRRRDLLAQMGVMLRGHLMPPPQYLSIHKEARLSDAEIDVIYKWERAERAKLKSD